MKNKDNPVPSLTKKEIEYIQENLLLNNNRSDIGESILKKLNGVETNNEQPKCNTDCTYNGGVCIRYCK